MSAEIIRHPAAPAPIPKARGICSVTPHGSSWRVCVLNLAEGWGDYMDWTTRERALAWAADISARHHLCLEAQLERPDWTTPLSGRR